MIIPITNRQGKVIGSITVSASVNNHVELIDVAEKFAATLEEIGAATVNETIQVSETQTSATIEISNSIQ